MRILHTADWHLGKKLDHYSRIEEQKEVMEEICAIAKEQQVDMVIVAGDLFDSFNPPIEATELLYRTLKKLTRNGRVPVIAIAGNHDSPDRVNVADVLARENGIIFIGHPTDIVPLFEVEDSFKLVKSEMGFIEIELPSIDKPIRLLHTAFANEVRLKEYFADDKQQALQDSLHNKWQALAEQYCDDKGYNLLTTHLFIGKRESELPEEPEGEKPLNIGNADIVYSDVIPKQVQYAALGHLHRYQDVGGNQPVIYSGSPLQYSFAEAGQQKYVSIVDIYTPNELPVITKIGLTAGKQLERKTFSNTDDAVEWLSQNKESLVELTMETDEFLKAEDRRLIYQTHSGVVHLIPKVRKTDNDDDTSSDIDINKNIDELFVDFFKSKNDGAEPNSDIMDMFNEIFGL